MASPSWEGEIHTQGKKRKIAGSGGKEECQGTSRVLSSQKEGELKWGKGKFMTPTRQKYGGDAKISLVGGRKATAKPCKKKEKGPKFLQKKKGEGEETAVRD